MTRRTAPLYLELRKTLAAELAAGKYPVGSRFPTEQELCERFGYARHTVREALRGLQEAGLLARQARAGTVVLALRPPELYAHRIDSIDGLWQYAMQTRFEAHQEGVIILRDRLAQTLGRTAGERWFRMAGCRRPIEGDAPLCWSEIFVAEPYLEIRPQLRDGRGPVYALLSEHFNLTIAQVERQITAIAMPADVALSLGTPAGLPALMERRTYFDARGEVFEISLSIHPGDRFAHTTRLVREPASGPRPLTPET